MCSVSGNTRQNGQLELNFTVRRASAHLREKMELYSCSQKYEGLLISKYSL